MQTANRNLPLVDPDQPQREGAARINSALHFVDADLATLMVLIAQKADTADIGPAITAAIDALVAGAPAALDTLAEIADKLAENDDAVAAIMSSLSNKANAANVYSRATIDGMFSAEVAARGVDVSALTASIATRLAKFTWETKTANFTAVAGGFYLITGGAVATLPAAPAESDRIGFLSEAAESTPYAINLSGKSFEGSTDNVAISKPLPVIFEYRNGAWRLAP